MDGRARNGQGHGREQGRAPGLHQHLGRQEAGEADDDGSQSQGGFKIWYVLVPLVLILAAVVAVIVIRKKKAKKAAALLDAEDLDGLEEVDLGEDTEGTDDADDTEKE